MPEVWQISTQGNPLATVKQFLTELWTTLELDAMLLPLKDPASGAWRPVVISATEELSCANPFTPIMAENIALRIKAFQRDHQGRKIAVLLRPCELRTWKEIEKKQPEANPQIISISTDCLGAYPLSEFGWRADRKGSDQQLTVDLLQFSPQGGIAAFRLRTACQLCSDPVAGQADINIHILGLPIREKILVSSNPSLSGKLAKIQLLSHAGVDLIENHHASANKLVARNQSTRKRLVQALALDPTLDLDSLADQLNTCEDCQSCMTTCPICASRGFKPGQSLSRQSLAEWMVACVGCGMCEEHCDQHLPLVKIFAIIKNQLDKIL